MLANDSPNGNRPPAATPAAARESILALARQLHAGGESPAAIADALQQPWARAGCPGGSLDSLVSEACGERFSSIDEWEKTWADKAFRALARKAYEQYLREHPDLLQT